MSLTVIFMIIIGGITLYAWQNPHLQNKWMMNPYQVVQRRQYYRLLSSGFLHSNQTHLIFNMIALYFFGQNVEYMYAHLFEQPLGTVFFVALFVAGIIISSIPAMIKHKDNPHYNALGASGGVSAIVFSSILINPLQDIYLFFVLPIPGFILGVLYLVYSYQQSKRGADNIGHEAHFAGAVFGLLFTLVLEPRLMARFIDQVSQYSLF